MKREIRANFTSDRQIGFSMLTEEQRREIYFTAVRILEDVGAEVYSKEGLETFSEAGCWIEGNRVRIPGGLTEWAVKNAPGEVNLYDQLGNQALNLGGSRAYFGPGPSNNDYIDPRTGERRKPLKADKADVARVCDFLPRIDFVMDLGTPSDVTDSLADVHSFAELVQHTTKPIVHWGFGIEQYQDIVDLASLVAGGFEKLQQKPFLALYSEPSSPLIHSQEALDKAIFCGKRRLPVIYTPCVMAGATGPVTMAGTIALGVAENLVGLVANQLINRGSPYIMGGVYVIMDMQTTLLSYGSPEFNVLQAGVAEVAHYLDIPVFGTAGCTDSCTLDTQAAIEATFNILTAAQAGGNLVHDVGYIESGNTGSLFQLVMCDEIIGMVRRFVRGIKVDEEHLALEVIKDTGPAGNFLEQEHTRKYFKEEFWFPEMLNRMRYVNWLEKAGGADLEEKIRARTGEILEEHEVEPPGKEVLESFEEIIDRAEEREAQSR